jgi:hypothetical protein
VPTVLLIRHAQATFGAAEYDVLPATGERQPRSSPPRMIGFNDHARLEEVEWRLVTCR